MMRREAGNEGTNAREEREEALENKPPQDNVCRENKYHVHVDNDLSHRL